MFACTINPSIPALGSGTGRTDKRKDTAEEPLLQGPDLKRNPYTKAFTLGLSKSWSFGTFWCPRLPPRLMINEKEKQTSRAGPTCSRCHTPHPSLNEHRWGF